MRRVILFLGVVDDSRLQLVEPWIFVFNNSRSEGVRAVDGVASCGGVIRDSNGIWVAGFSKFIGRCSMLEAEFWAVFEGLCYAKSFNVSKVVVEFDNQDVIDVLLMSA
ncbi:hypothetical protein V6N11_032989 [Hibiscus sabdariffa]|uniref:RNase H type-1 domain-containing protein n=1 Tax=Hibiscus sabdariffa TaxID=183260 RepID=A0ABR1ZME8_9ROSI